MTPEALAQELEREPFVPLRLRLDDGRSVEIHNPGAAFISNLSLYAFHTRKAGGVLADDSRLISLLQIVSVEQVEPNGRPRRPRRQSPS